MSTDATPEPAPAYGSWKNVKVSRRFFDLLIQHPVFQAEPKAINSALYWLAAIDTAMVGNDDEPVTWEWEDIADRFRPYSQPYKFFRDALRDLGLITFSRYRPPPNAFVDGECRKFTVTPLGQQCIADENYEWLYKLLTDKKAQANNRSAISNRKSTRIVYTDRMMRIIDDLHYGVKFQKEGLLALMERQKTEAPQRLRSALHHLLALERRKFKELKIQEGRIFHRFVALPREYRPLAIYKGKPYVATVDIRACHSTFFGELMRSFYQMCLDERLAEAPFPTILDRADAVEREVNPQQLQTECQRWTGIFTDAEDPRMALSRMTGIGISKGDMKECLNRWLNGGKEYRREADGRRNRTDTRRLEAWFKEQFPSMAKVWSIIEDRHITGPTITARYEFPLMADPALYALGNELGLSLAYEYDGVGVFADPNDPEFLAKLERVKMFIESKSAERFGVRVVVNVDKVTLGTC